ncbi:hypothetical protein E6W36_08445 [Hankyongella ginsenosidimutans]|uniref:Uncharacterized protein n=1 Tax=Hankyongella ginsenosidimutans TaxID=1763828 RepID=A0A4D7CBG4_9SPHN|nr:AHH domain-containing protein [Hankyongella ginsenosidimutans]QCI79556.1 hypothetical protein E6W36_08445 [Hankyongella ginsenosidimutans]
MTSFFQEHHGLPRKFADVLMQLGFKLNDPRNLVGLPTSTMVARDPTVNTSRHTGNHSKVYFKNIEDVLESKSIILNR